MNNHHTMLRFLRFRFLFLMSGVIVIILVLVLGREFMRDREIQQDILTLQKQADEIEARNLEIVELGSLMQTESYIEREARLKLGLKKPGEEVVVVERKQQEDATGASQTDESGPLLALVDPSKDPMTYKNTDKWWMYFFDHDSFVRLCVYAKN